MLTPAYSLSYALAGNIIVNMDCQKAIRRTTLGLTFLLAGGLFTNLLLAQDSKQAKTDWGQVRKAVDAYFSSPTEENARRVLSALPNEVDYETTNLEAFVSIVDGIYNDHILKLSALVRKGDRLALRIAYNYAKFTDGFFYEQMCSLLGNSIVVMPEIFLDETLLFRKNNPRSNVADDEGLRQILCYFIDFDAFRPEVISKEISARIKALESVDRADLLEFKDDCLRRLRKRLETLRHQTPDSQIAEAVYLP